MLHRRLVHCFFSQNRPKGDHRIRIEKGEKQAKTVKKKVSLSFQFSSPAEREQQLLKQLSLVTGSEMNVALGLKPFTQKQKK